MTRNIPYYVTGRGLLLKIDTSHPQGIRINGAPLASTFHPNWWLVEGERILSEVAVHAGTRAINERYVLLNEAVEGLERVILKEDVVRDEDCRWVGRHLGLDSLYRYEKDDEDLGFSPSTFVGEHLGSVDLVALGDPTAFRYKLHRHQHNERDGELAYKDIFQQYTWLEAQIGVDDIAKAMTPDVAWHLYPCSVSSEVAYRIIRSHVKDNIDPRFAEVTSDYDFCFTVKKKIRQVPFIRKWELTKDNGKSYRPPRFKQSTVEYEKREVFEMTSAKNPYRGYTVVEGFQGESLADLAEAIDRYLAELMAVINAPLTRCPHCEGRGVTDYFRLPTNERAQFKLEAA